MANTLAVCRRTAVWGLSTYAAFGVWTMVCLMPFTNLDKVSKDLDDEEDEDREPLFFPIPGTRKLVKPLPYAGAEEEWQAFVKHGKDWKLRRQLILNVKDMTRVWCLQSPTISMFGKDFKVVNSTLKHIFPQIPPPEIERSGFQREDGKFVWKTKKMDARAEAFHDHFGYPTAMYHGSKAFAQELVMQNVRKVGTYLGYESKGPEIPPANPKRQMAKALKQLENRQTTDGATTSSTSSTSAAASSTEVATATSATDKKTPATFIKGGSHEAADQTEKPISAKDLIPYYSHFAQEAQGPWEAFKRGYVQHWRPFRSLPPRGSLCIMGSVDLEAEKGYVEVDVCVFWHPKTKEFHDESARFVVKTIRPKRFGPLR